MDRETYTLVVRTPNQQIPDIAVDCDNGWTISQLKSHLAEVYPYKPAVDKQKIIYRGQLLTNTSLLKDIFKNCDENNGSFTIHLICNTIETVRKTPTMTPPQPTPVANSTIWPGQNHQPVHYLYNQMNDGQAAWFQQAYMQYWTNYMQLMASQGLASPYISPVNLPMSENADNMANNNEHLQRPPPQINAEILNNNNNNNNINNNNFGLDEGANRDWVDNVYMLSRIIVLFSIVYFYSSPLRFAAVTLLGFLLYLYKARFFRTYLLFADNNHPRGENNNQVVANENNNPEPDRPEVIERRARIEEANDDTNESDNPAATQTNNNENEVQRPGLLSFTWIFFSSFFASLIPDVADVV